MLKGLILITLLFSAIAARGEEWTLNDVRRIAEEKNPDLKTAQFNYQAASKRITEAWSGYLPRADLGGTYEQTNLPQPSAGLGSQLGIQLPYSSVVARIRQTVFDFGRTLNAIDSSRADANAAGQGALALKQALLLQVEIAFFNVSTAAKLVDVAQQGVVQFDETVRRTGVFVRTGTRPSFDLSQANVELSRAKLGFANAENVFDLAKITLLMLMGLPQDTAFTLKEPPPTPVADLARLNLHALSEEAIGRRPEVKRGEYAVESARSLLNQQYKDYLPTVGLEGWYGRYLPNYPTSINEAWGGGVTLTWNLFDGFDTTARVGEYRARVNAEDSRLDKQRDDIRAQVAQSFMDLKKSELNLQVARESLGFSIENESLAKKRYDAHVATFLELLVAESGLLDAQAAEVQARYQYEISLASLENAVNRPLKEILP